MRRTFSRIAGETLGLSRKAGETVDRWTPARAATSCNAGARDTG